MTISKWKNIPGVTVVYENGLDVEIIWKSTGYYDSGSFYGGSDKLGWPPEGDDERTLDCVLVDGVRVEHQEAEAIFTKYYDEVMKTELDDPDLGLGV